MNNAITVYDYIAANDPTGTEAICNKYGYSLQNMRDSQDLAQCLAELVNEEGEPALTDILSIHPDREVLLQKFSGEQPTPNGNNKCKCGNCSGKGVTNQYIEQAHQTAGYGLSMLTSNPAGLFIIGGVILLSLAIITKN